MCDCIQVLEEKMKEHVINSGRFKKKIINVQFKDKVFSISDNLSLKTVSYFQIELEGQKKMPEISIQHSYCPFCGEKKTA